MAEEETYRITQGCALWMTVRDWNLTPEWNAKIYDAAFEDLMKTLVRAGYVEEKNG